MSYPFDGPLRERVTELLYGILPALYRIRDLGHGRPEPLGADAPPGTEELRKFIRVLAAPLAEVRQNVDELHADLFVDSCDDSVLPYLAAMVGMELVFPDADANRRDVRGTVGWRRRKGTPLMLQEMASDLAAQIVVTHEGWKRLAMTQHLALLRPERIVPALVDPSVAETAGGPLDRAFHSVDVRAVGRGTGLYHPRHVAHWLHPTRLFPVREGTPAPWQPPAGPHAPVPGQDLRWVFQPLGRQAPLRVRRREPTDPLATDRVPPMRFAASPQSFFDQTGVDDARFTVRIAGLPATVAGPVAEERAPSATPAHPALVSAPVDVRPLELRTDRLIGTVAVDLLAVPLVPSQPGGAADRPSLAGAVRRATLRVSDAGGELTLGDAGAVPAPCAAMLRLRPEPGAFTYFPGAVVELVSRAADAHRSVHSEVPCTGSDLGELAQRGFLSGAAIVELPATWIHGARWLWIAADGSIYDAQSPAAAQSGADPDVLLAAGPGGTQHLSGEPLAIGPHPAWPPLSPTCDPEPYGGGPSAPGRGPVVLRGGPVLDLSGSLPVPVPAGTALALTFAFHTRTHDHPFLRLAWSGADPTSAATFTWLDLDAGALVPATTASAAHAALLTAARFDADADGAELLVRLEATAPDLALPPCELAWSGHDGRTVLVHLPELRTVAPVGAPPPFPAIAGWPAGLPSVSAPVRVQDDGSTVLHPSGALARWAYGPIAPIPGAATLRRRKLRHRVLSGWSSEEPDATPPKLLPSTPPGCLDLDPAAGLFALAPSEPPPSYPTSVEALGAPASLTVDWQEGCSAHLGARPAARAPLLGEMPAWPTRVVMGAGRFHRDAGNALQEIPRYASVSAALAAIATDPVPAAQEVVQIEDSATYRESLVWPSGPRSITIQAAESERPVLVLAADVARGTAAYDQLTLVGLAIAQSGHALAFPSAEAIQIAACTALGADDRWAFAVAPGAGGSLTVESALLGGIDVAGGAEVSIADAILDASSGPAISAPDAQVTLERVTVAADEAALPGDRFGTDVKVLYASEVLFTGRARARNRFQGGIRYSRAGPGSVLPRAHRVVEDEPRFVAHDRFDPAYLRLAERCPASIVRGAEDGSELGAFHGARLAQRIEALAKRIEEYTPAGLQTGLLRQD